MMEENKNRFVGYDYKEVKTEPGQASFLMDGYENFGWQEDGHFGSEENSAGKSKTVIRMKRDRKIMNKAELTRLQRNFEACIAQIGDLEHSKKAAADIVSLLIGIVGTSFMAGSTFAVTAPVPNIPLCIILAIPGLVGWILPYFVYKTMVRRKTEKVEPFIEAKYDEIYDLCEKGSKLLY